MRRSTVYVSMFVCMFCTFFVMASCSGDEVDVRKKSEIKKDIRSAEGEVTHASREGAITEEFTEASEKLMAFLFEYYESYPDDKYAAGCLTKIHMLHSAFGNVDESIKYGDKLLKEYPKAKNRAQVIESQIQTYEIAIKPRNTEKIKQYLKMWLAENKKAPKEKIEDMKYHLKYVDMSLEERMRMNMEELD